MKKDNCWSEQSPGKSTVLTVPCLLGHPVYTNDSTPTNTNIEKMYVYAERASLENFGIFTFLNCYFFQYFVGTSNTLSVQMTCLSAYMYTDKFPNVLTKLRKIIGGQLPPPPPLWRSPLPPPPHPKKSELIWLSITIIFPSQVWAEKGQFWNPTLSDITCSRIKKTTYQNCWSW